MDSRDNDDFLEFLDFVEENMLHINIPRRYVLDAENPVEFYDELEFQNRYRFSKNIIVDIILPLVTANLATENNQELPIPQHIQLLTCLRYFATGNFQEICRDLKGVSQSTASDIIKRVSESISGWLPEFIYLPNNQEQKTQNTILFQAMAGFPGVAACLDCIHIKIKSPGGEIAEVFRNRKGYFSLNVQVAVGPQGEILDIFARHPGSTPDRVIFDRSSLRVHCERGDLNGILLGDSKFPCRPYLLTPIIHPGTEQEARYNEAHTQTRNVVKRVFSRWKQRFPVIHRGITTKLEATQAVICATATLHNISVKYKDNYHFKEVDPDI